MPFLLVIFVMIFPAFGLYYSATQLNSSNKSMRYSATFCVALFFGFAGLIFTPTPYTDLSRYYINYIDPIRNMDLHTYISSIAQIDYIAFVQNMYFFLISRAPNDNLLPAVTMFLTYGVAVYLLSQFGLKLHSSRKSVVQSFFILVVGMPFAVLANNTRNILAVAIFLLAINRELLQEKKDVLTYILYIVACSMHISVLALVACRIFASIVKSLFSGHVIQVFGYTILGVGTLFFLDRLSFFQSFIDKMMAYFQGGGDGSDLHSWFVVADKSPLILMNKRIGSIVGIIVILLLVQYLRHHVSGLNSNQSTLLVFFIIVSVLVVILTFRPGTTWNRFYFVLYFVLPWIFLLYSDTENHKIYFVLFWVILVLWNFFWQYYSFKNQSSMTQNDYMSLLFPVLSLWRI